MHRNKEEREKNNESIHALNKQLNELGSAHKALKGQCAARGREMRAEQELHLRNVRSLEQQMTMLDIEGEEQDTVVACLRKEVALLKREKDFAVELMYVQKSEARARAAGQQGKIAAAKAAEKSKGKRLTETRQELQVAKEAVLANRQKYVRVAEGQEKPKHYRDWGQRMLESTMRWSNMTESRVLESCRALVCDLESKLATTGDLPKPEDFTSWPTLRKRSWRAGQDMLAKLGPGWRGVLTNFLEGASKDSLEELMPEQFAVVVHEAKVDFMNKLSEHWSGERLLHMKIDCKLSRRNYTKSRAYYFKELDKATGNWVSNTHTHTHTHTHARTHTHTYTYARVCAHTQTFSFFFFF